MQVGVERRDVAIELEQGAAVHGTLAAPRDPAATVVFAHGSGSSRRSPRNVAVASVLTDARFATLLVDLLTEDEEDADRATRHLRFDVGLLSARVEAAMGAVANDAALGSRPVGLFGASTGAAAALVAAARRPHVVRAVVSRGGRPDLAGDALALVRAPTLLLVGGRDDVVLELNAAARERMTAARVELQEVPGATHLFEEAGALERVAALARAWFEEFLV